MVRRWRAVMTASDDKVRGGKVETSSHEHRWRDGIEHIPRRKAPASFPTGIVSIRPSGLPWRRDHPHLVIDPWTESGMEDAKIEASFGSRRERTAAGDALLNVPVNLLIMGLTRLGLLRKDLDYHLVRASMVLVFLLFGYQKWFEYEAQVLIPFISNGPLISWMYPVFGVRGAGWFLGVSGWE